MKKRILFVLIVCSLLLASSIYAFTKQIIVKWKVTATAFHNYVEEGIYNQTGESYNVTTIYRDPTDESWYIIETE